MPTYVYTCNDCGRHTTAIRLVRDRRKAITCPECLGIAPYDFGATAKGVHVSGGGGQGWPMESSSLGVPPKQRRQLAEFLRSKGVPTHINARGNPVLTDRAHRAKVCRALGAYDQDAGYGDAAPSVTPKTEKELETEMIDEAVKQHRKTHRKEREKALKTVTQLYNRSRRKADAR